MVLRRPLTKYGTIAVIKIDIHGSFRRFCHLLEFIKGIYGTYILDTCKFTDGFGYHAAFLRCLRGLEEVDSITLEESQVLKTI